MVILTVSESKNFPTLTFSQAGHRAKTLALLEQNGVSMEEIEKKLICEALARTGGHILKASKLLGMTYKTFQYRMKKYGIKV